jgi:tRNA pseudouridine38-40 synthase
MRYFLEITYDGTEFKGYQYQTGQRTVQDEVEKALRMLLRHEVVTLSSGRTDTGVHAEQQYVQFDTDNELEQLFLLKMNGIMPKDIGARALYRCADPQLSARFGVDRRTYRYRIVQTKEPMTRNYAWWLRYKLDEHLMNEACQRMIQHRDFQAFSKIGSQKTTICTVHSAYCERHGDEVRFYITANRYLRGMVRIIVGNLVKVGCGYITVDDFEERLASRERERAFAAAPANGLAFYRISYHRDSLELLQVMGQPRPPYWDEHTQ